MRRVFIAGYTVALAFGSETAWGQSPPTGAFPAPAVQPGAPPAAGVPSAPAAASPPTGGESNPEGTQSIRVLTTDGAEFRGTLVERIPGQYVTVLLATGESRRIAWGAIAKITGPTTDASSVAPEGQKGIVRFDADDSRARLEKFVGVWQPVCSTPCEGNLSLDGSYRVGGEGIRASEPFRLPTDGRVRIDANVGTDGRAVAGGVLAIGGGIVAYIGALVFLVGAAESSTDSNSTRLSDSSRTSLRTTGGVVTLAGAAAGITGLVLLINNKTDVHVSRGAGGASVTPRLRLAGPFELGPDGIRF